MKKTLTKSQTLSEFFYYLIYCIVLYDEYLFIIVF